MKKYYIKNRDKIVGYLYRDETNNTYSATVLDRRGWWIPVDKDELNDKEVKEWMDEFVNPEYQGGYRDILINHGIDPSSPSARQELYFKFRGTNISLPIWVTEDEFEEFGPNVPIWCAWGVFDE